MADNYIERREEELRNAPKRGALGGFPACGTSANLDTLLVKNRSTRGYDKSYVVHERQLLAIVSVADKVPSARNQQVLRFRLVLRDEASKVLPLIGMGRNLPELHLPFPGTEPEAFIVFCTSHPDAPHLGFDEGIMAQSMLLKAAEMGLSGLIIKNFSPERMKEALGIDADCNGEELHPLTVLAIGKGIEKIKLTSIPLDGSVGYYRTPAGTHYVPKYLPSDLIIK